jgi:hypothetical protein
MSRHVQLGLLTVTLLVFTAYTAWVVHAIGYLTVFKHAFSMPGSLQVYVDLALCCTLALAWIWQDMRRRGQPLVYFFAISILTLALGSIGPLTYLIERASRGVNAASHEIA